MDGQRKIAPTPEEMALLVARRQHDIENVALLKKEEEGRKARECSSRKISSMGKGDGPDLKSFIQQLPFDSDVDKSGKPPKQQAASGVPRNKRRKWFLIKQNRSQSQQSQQDPVPPLDQEHGNLLHDYQGCKNH